MSRHFLLGFVASVMWFAIPATAPAEEKPKTTISAENAHRVEFRTHAATPADRLVRGPKPGELILQSSVMTGPRTWTYTAEVVDDTTLRQVRPLAKGRQPTHVAVSPDGKLAAFTEREGTVYTVEEIATGKSFDIEIGRMPCDAAFSPDGKLLAIGYLFSKPRSEGEGYSEVRLFDTAGKLVRTLGQNGYGSVRPVFSPDGKILAAGNRNRVTQLFDVATGKLLHELDKRMTHEIAFSPDGKTLAAGYVDGTVALWDVATGKLLRSAPSGGKEVYSVDWSPKGDVLASSGFGGKIVLWEPGKLTKLKELDADTWVLQVRFTSDGTRLLSANDHAMKDERRVSVWAVPGGGK